MSKFKAGDRVVMIGRGGPRDILVATLNRLIPDGEPFAGEWQATCSDGDCAVFREDQIELIGAPQPDHTILTRRDHFAMAALTGLCGNCDSTGMFSWTPEGVADFANRIADLMEAARNKKD